MKPHEKSAASKLYFCPTADCRVINFKPNGTHPFCPSCGIEGELVRDPVKRG